MFCWKDKRYVIYDIGKSNPLQITAEKVSKGIMAFVILATKCMIDYLIKVSHVVTSGKSHYISVSLDYATYTVAEL